MSTAGIIRDDSFELISEFAKPDAKKRLTLPEALAAAGATAFNVYKNAVGQIVLDPVLAVPAAEVWLYRNPAALAAVQQGMKESAEGKTVDLGSFAKFAG